MRRLTRHRRPRFPVAPHRRRHQQIPAATPKCSVPTKHPAPNSSPSPCAASTSPTAPKNPCSTILTATNTFCFRTPPVATTPKKPFARRAWAGGDRFEAGSKLEVQSATRPLNSPTGRRTPARHRTACQGRFRRPALHERRPYRRAPPGRCRGRRRHAARRAHRFRHGHLNHASLRILRERITRTPDRRREA